MKYASRLLALGVLSLCVPCLLVTPAGAAGEHPVPAVISLSGDDWFIRAEDPARPDAADWASAELGAEGWIPARVPGNIQADMEAARHLTPHWYGEGDDRIWEIARQAWWYGRDIEIPASCRGQRMTLVFEGVDPACRVYVNGVMVGEAAGMYRRLQFDVTDAIRPGQVNRVAVRIPKMPEELDLYHRMADITSPLQSHRPDGTDYYPNGINRVRQVLQDLKSPTNFGWDWGVCIWTMGIWKDGRIEATGPARIDAVRVRSTLTEDYRKAEVEVEVEINAPAAMSVRASVRLIGDQAPAAVEQTSPIEAGDTTIRLLAPVSSPALWWPNGQGDQPLYTAVVTLRDADSGRLLDERRERFGIREIRWGQVEGAPEDFINPYQLLVNGRPVRMMGSNLIPPDLLFGRIMERGPMLLRRAHAAGMNTLRIWGGGVILPTSMYDLADELGLMLSQEFPLANSWPETDAAFLGNLETTVTSIIKQTRNHPSIIEWSGGNEMPWEQGTDHAALHLLERLVAQHDGRIFRATCPIQGSHKHGPWTFDPGSMGVAGEHLLGYDHYNGLTQMRHGEFGAPSPAHVETWHHTIPPSLHRFEQHLDHRIIRRKKIVYAVFGPNLWMVLPQLHQYFGPADDLPMTVAAGQFLGAEGLRYGMDSHRQRGARMGGFMSWNFNEPWPNGAGSYMVDHYGRPLMNYDFARQALAPVALSLRHEGILYPPEQGLRAKVMLVSDATQPHAGMTWRWVVRDRRGGVVASNSGVVGIAPREVMEVDTIAVQLPEETALGPFLVELSLTDAQGVLLGERVHIFASSATRAGLRGLLRQDVDDRDDHAADLPGRFADELTGPRNLAYVGNGAQPAVATSAHSLAIHQPAGLNDGRYGNAHAWIGVGDGASFTIDLGRLAVISEARLGRDRTGEFSDRAANRLEIDASADGTNWRAVADVREIPRMEGFGMHPTFQVRFPPVEARVVRVTVHAHQPGAGNEVAIDECELYGPEAGAPPPASIEARFLTDPPLFRPVRRTTLALDAPRLEQMGDRERLTLTLRNTGAMTALFCAVHPMLEYRTDLFIEPNHVSVPPGESRTVTIEADLRPGGALTLSGLGWQVLSWNADPVMTAPGTEVVLAVGREDGMCQEFKGVLTDVQRAQLPVWRVLPGQPDAATVAHRLGQGDAPVELDFEVDDAASRRGLDVWLVTADRSAEGPVRLAVTVNGRPHSVEAPAGYGIQADQPAHLAEPASMKLHLPAGTLTAGRNRIRLSVEGGGWITWDAIRAVVR